MSLVVEGAKVNVTSCRNTFLVKYFSTHSLFISRHNYFNFLLILQLQYL